MKLSVVTPSFNQAEFLPATIQSVVGQGYPDLEYVIVDGGSSDASAAIIERHRNALHYWVSEPDGGQYDALNKGFARTSGDIMAWLNSDDLFTPWAFRVVAEIFEQHPEVEWLTTAFPLTWDERGLPVGCIYNGGFNRDAFYRGENLPGLGWYATRWIQQESTFWRRSLWERSGARLRSDLPLAADFELWARFFESADLYAASVPLGGFRLHQRQKTGRHLDRYLAEAAGVLERYGQPRATGLLRHIRRLSSRVVPRGLWQVGHSLGLVHPRRIIRFDIGTQRWRADVDYA